MKPETTTVDNPVGLYYDKESKTYIGCIDPIQADAVVRLGYVLVKEGREASITTQVEMDKMGTPAKKESK
ncbi:MAG: hypothetical protein WCJ60_02345 [bacterium]